MAIITLMIFSLIMNPLVSNENTGSIYGSVTDSRGHPLIGATVLIVGTSYGAMTNRIGVYEISNLSPGVYSVIAMMVGMSDKTAEGVTVQGNTLSPVNFSLTHYPHIYPYIDNPPIIIKI